MALSTADRRHELANTFAAVAICAGLGAMPISYCTMILVFNHLAAASLAPLVAGLATYAASIAACWESVKLAKRLDPYP